MKKFIAATAIATAFGIAGFTQSVLAGDAAWVLSGENSKVSYGTIKKGAVGEVNHFASVSGHVSKDGAVEVAIDLASVETFIDIRNERMVKHVFNASPKAVLSANIDLAEVNDLKAGDSTLIDVEGTLALGAGKVDVETSMFVARLSDQRVMVTTDEMIMVSAVDLGVNEGVDKLMELAKLPSITRAVPVTLRLVFDQASDTAAAPVSAGVQTASLEVPAGDVKKGKNVFKRCKACHVANKEKNKVGPHLVGIIGRQAGAVDGFKYSDVLAKGDITWDVPSLTAFLTKPKDFAPGNKMTFGGLKKEKDINNLLAYLASL